jgi:hypothetical protein
MEGRTAADRHRVALEYAKLRVWEMVLEAGKRAVKMQVEAGRTAKVLEDISKAEALALVEACGVEYWYEWHPMGLRPTPRDDDGLPF